MADEKTEEIVKPEAPPKTEAELPVAKKSDPLDDLGDTLDKFLAGIFSAGIRGMDSMSKEFKKKADAVIEKLDGGAGDPPKQP